MAGTGIETTAPTLARVRDHREHLAPWVLVLGVTYLAAGIAAAASRLRVGQWWSSPVWEFERTVWPHATAMTVVVWVALAITVALLRARLFAVAVLMWAGAAFGPLRLVAAPVFGDVEFIDDQPSATQATWPVTVAAGVLCVGATSSAGWRVLLAVAAPLSMWWAYHRDGGWPGAPGWDYGMQSPLFLTTQITAVLIVAAVVGWGLAAGGLGARLRGRYAHRDSATAHG